MLTNTFCVPNEILAYTQANGVREDSHLKKLRVETATHPMAVMQISPEQGQLMSLLVELIGARRAIEVGTFTGYSAMWIAKGMGPHGHLVALEVSEEYAAIARRHWADADMGERIELRLGPAAVSLAAMTKQQPGAYDFVFVDADKPGYDTYYEYALRLLHPGGLVAFDNALLEGEVIDPENNSQDVVAMRAFNLKLISDMRVSVCMVPIRDGLYLVRKR